MVVCAYAEAWGFTSVTRPLRLERVQRLFVSFPDGWPGIGLLWLRLVVGIALALQGASYLSGFLEANMGVWGIVGMAVVGGLCLIGGLFTPAAGIAAIVVSILVATGPIHESQLFFRLQGSLLLAAATISIMLIGPGAYSIDARLFGRREILIPR
jgi:putative oxidoreductase